MRERIRERAREPEVHDAAGYWVSQKWTADLLDRGVKGMVVIDGEKARKWELGPMGNHYRYIYEGLHDDTALTNWWVFKQDVRIHSGAHRHQGGLVIFVVEGKGWSVVDGVREDWEAGDLLLLPLRPDGVEHQHFNAVQGESCTWVAFIYMPFWNALLSKIELTKDGPEWKAANKASAVGLDAPA